MRVSDLRYKLLWLVLGWIVVVIALVLNLMPASALQGDRLNDKVEHTAGYVILTAWFCGIYSRSRYWRVAAAFLLMGVAIEILQGLMQLGRQADVHDVYADAAGIAVGILLAWFTALGRWAQHLEALLFRK